MTEHRNLKRLVRERAARTGESYSTARRHVLSRVEPPATLPPGLVPGYDQFGGGTHHESTLLAHLLRQAGHVAPHTGEPYSEAMLCGLAGGVGFLYAVFEYRGLPPMVTLVAQHHPEPWLPAALGRLGIGYAEEHSGAAPRALTALYRFLDDGRPVYCTVARPVLPWRHDAPGLETDPFPIVVAGRHDGALLVDDQAVTPHRIPADVFAAAWSACRKGRHHRLTVARPGDPVDLPRAVRAAVATTVAHLTGPVRGNSFDVNLGFSGMARLAEQLRGSTKAGWSRRFAVPGALPLGLRRLHDCLEEQYTGPGATRPLYADFLDEASALLKEPAWSAAAASFRTAGQHWSALAARALDASGPVAELVEQRLFRRLTGADVGDLTTRIDAVMGEPPAEPAELFAELAARVDAARAAEQDAVTHLAAT